jgi:hypothetical protein
VELEVLTQVLKHTGGNKARAARLLQVDYKTIHQKLKKLGIWERRIGNGDQEADPEPEPAESTEAFDLASTAQPGVLGVDVPQRWEQRRAPLAT